MTNSATEVPVHDSLIVTETETIYKTGAWWKAVVTYNYEGSEDDETAIYLWNHDDDEWKRKNKYVIKTVDAWETDKQVIDTLLAKDTGNEDVSNEFPTSDYYTVAGGVTVFQTDKWWKGVLNIAQKGSYETNEVMVYLWQDSDGDWKRRQKYTIKSREDWEEEKSAIESMLYSDEKSASEFEVDTASTSQTEDDWADIDMMETEPLTGLEAELDDHLGEALE